jgi:hypothetical protein
MVLKYICTTVNILKLFLFVNLSYTACEVIYLNINPVRIQQNMQKDTAIRTKYYDS